MIGYVFGVYYWQTFVRFPCTPVLISTTQIKYSFYHHFQYRTTQTCQNENSQLFLTIAIISSYERLLIYLPAILNTWILTATIDIEIIVFIEEKSLMTEEAIEKIFFQLNKNTNQYIKCCLYIVKLKNVENSYPPQKKSFYAMKFIYAFYRQRTSWLLRLDDNAYVNIEELVKWLKSIDHRKTLYIGQGGSGRQNGPPILFPPEKYFCMGGSGVILSQSTLIQLGPWLDQCLNNETRTRHEDVELGRCILNHVHVGCVRAYNAKSLFYHHYGSGYEFGYDFTPSIISQALIMHPIKNQNTFREIFSFYIRLKQERQYLKNNKSLKKSMNKQTYVTFLSNTEFNSLKDAFYEKIDVRWRSYIEQAVKLYIEKTKMIWHTHSSNWTVTNGKFVFGYYCVKPSYGLNVIVEVRLTAYPVSKNSTKAITIVKRLRINQPFTTKHRFDYREINNIQIDENIYQLNLIVVSSNKDEPLLRLINNYEREVLSDSFRREHFTLTILYFSEKNETTNRMIHLINELSVKYISIIRISIINQNQNQISYNRGLGRYLATELFTNNQLLFFLDVDLLFTGQALDNTRRLMIHPLSISSCTVYFPIVFSFFSNMSVVDNNLIVDVNSKHGLFSIYGFGNVVVRKQDLDRIGGWETHNRDWGMEDVNLFDRFSHPSSKCYIYRTVEPGLRHYYHKKMCNGIMNKIRKKMCLDVDIMLYGSQNDMVNYLFNNKNLMP
ncbi:unnamed protein product [Rotaria sp. Silwood2]|nr:unnamed protein product [Rotaria sp. Silwood2]CAF2598058.1 unnamed protein product [Rotaria sp. Silwood2]CAF3986933.1 unnamed protein product [Rotaria sp. Silwood2]CAF4234072.1 unnamed protein product [Rotaria sp. Silwood2]